MTETKLQKQSETFRLIHNKAKYQQITNYENNLLRIFNIILNSI